MNRYECFEFLAPLIKDQLVVGSLSGQRVEWGVCPGMREICWWRQWVRRWGSALGCLWCCRIEK